MAFWQARYLCGTDGTNDNEASNIMISNDFQTNKPPGTDRNSPEQTPQLGAAPDRFCRNCGEEVALLRWRLSYRTCLSCGEVEAKAVKHTIVPMHKSNYVLVTDNELLRGINNKQMK